MCLIHAIWLTIAGVLLSIFSCGGCGPGFHRGWGWHPHRHFRAAPDKPETDNAPPKIPDPKETPADETGFNAPKVPDFILANFVDQYTAPVADAPEAQQVDRPKPAPSSAPHAKPQMSANGRQTGKLAGPGLVFFKMNGCAPCEGMKGTVGLAAQKAMAHLITVNVSNNPAIGRHYAVTEFPTFIAIDAAGNETGRLTGVCSVDQLVELANQNAPIIYGAEQGGHHPKMGDVCCPDCICHGNCQCTYPGECLLKFHNCQPGDKFVVVTSTGEERVYVRRSGRSVTMHRDQYTWTSQPQWDGVSVQQAVSYGCSQGTCSGGCSSGGCSGGSCRGGRGCRACR